MDGALGGLGKGRFKDSVKVAGAFGEGGFQDSVAVVGALCGVMVR
jgi:hypothetical protein